MNNDFFGNESISEPLYVITSVFNPYRYKSRYRLYQDFERQMLQNKNVILVTVECTFGEREAVIHSTNSRHKVVHVHSNSEIWLKENLLNIGIQSLPKKARYVATIDADITFSRPDWVAETIHELQHYPVVQMFSSVVYLTPNYENLKENPSLISGWLNGVKFQSNGESVSNESKFKDTYTPEKYGYGWNGAPGGAWAFRREVIEELGGLLDFGIVGGGDSYMAFAFLGVVDGLFNPEFKFNETYVDEIMKWQERAVKVINHSVGCVSGIIFHHWHGKTELRKYWTRNHILSENDFNPLTDLEKNSQGVYKLTNSKPKLVSDLRFYFKQRNEDGVDV